ncbi:apolipoprotein N-acyltransferase [Streptomyces jumonjinensis]|uniref:Apolipoprotein N-acyltransferase n=1 Tax=Streptomyces jumonjinensis TaxID=1945 RepID=A0A646KF62_STRJU|nr:apolipoprotein N-acyltransferase [Streptomyces jumonjinensis]MQT00929.1 apolipoprotein N-acyltransferase [Streptomyces jumonjinensis]
MWRNRAGRLITTPGGRSAAAVVAGALPVLAFPEPSLWWFAYIALVPWLLLIRTAPTGRRAAVDGWLGGLGFMIAVHHWLIPSLHVFTVVLAALLGLLWAPWGWLVHSLLGTTAPAAGPDGASRARSPSRAGSRPPEEEGSATPEPYGTGAETGSLPEAGAETGARAGAGTRSGTRAAAEARGGTGPTPLTAAAAIAVVPAGWLMIELARSWEGLGGPWGLLGASQWEVSPALRLASAGGVWLVSLLVVAVNTALAVLIALPRARTAVLGGVLVCALATTAVWAWTPVPEKAGRARIAIVQPGVISGEDSVERRFARGEELTRELAGQKLDLVVWGESSVGDDLRERPDLAARLARLSQLVGAELLVNVDARRTDGPGREGIFKSSVLVGPAGPTGDRYDKMRLVPFGEYVPARALLGWATSVGKAAGEDRLRGTHPVVMDLADGGPRVGPLVCFESAFPDMSRALVRRGAELLVAQSATSTFQDSWAPAQHASLAALRAAESGRPMVHATLTGVSVVHGPDGGRVGGVLGTNRSAAAVYDVPLARGTTAYVRFGGWPLYGALAVLLALCALRGARRFRRTAPAPSAPPARTAHGSSGRPGR